MRYLAVIVTMILGFTLLSVSEARAQWGNCWSCTNEGPGGCCYKTPGGGEDCQDLNCSWCELEGLCADPEASLAGWTDSLILPSGEAVSGRVLSEDAVAVRDCDGKQVAVVYTEAGKVERKKHAREIELR